MTGAVVFDPSATTPRAPGYVACPFHPRRRATREVFVGDVGIGGDHPIRVQSMTTTDTMDAQATADQAERLARAGCELVRITTPTPADAEQLGTIKRLLARRGIRVPIIADIHFNPAAALAAVPHCEKVRINPGNYADQKRFVVREYSDAEYQAELERIEQRFKPLVLACRDAGVAMRIGTNHGSLSDRIMNRFGDTPLGMVESALEFVRICRAYNYHQIVLSMKSSNPKVMVYAYRLLAARLDELGWNYPLHLGVTEAGGGDEGRVKSAVGIGALLADGLGDTVRVSLTEDPVAEIPVAQHLVRPYNARRAQGRSDPVECGPACAGAARFMPAPYSYARRTSVAVDVGPFSLGAGEPVRVLSTSDAVTAIEPSDAGGIERTALDLAPITEDADRTGEHAGAVLLCASGGVSEAVDALLASAARWVEQGERGVVLALRLHTPEETIRGYRLLSSRLAERGAPHPLHLVAPASGERLDALVDASTALGALLVDGIGDSVEVVSGLPGLFPARLGFHILQAAGVRITRAELIACPGCGRTLFDLESTAERIKERTQHLTGVRVAVMGCIVNGPGEMADADFGYVGGAPGRVNLYVGKEVVERNVPEDAAPERLVELIRSRGRWRDPPPERPETG